MGVQARKFDPAAAEAWSPATRSPKPLHDAPDLPAPDSHEAMEQWAAHELSHALSHDWLELEPLAPFADVTDCEPEAGRPYEVVRSYRWAEHEGGDMVCEVTVYATPDRQGHFVRRRCVIRKS